MTNHHTAQSPNAKRLLEAFLDPAISTETWLAFCFEEGVEPDEFLSGSGLTVKEDSK